MPYGRCVIYMFPGDAEEIIAKARTGILPIFKSQPGFVAYGVMVRGNQLISMSAWKSERDAKAADELARNVLRTSVPGRAPGARYRSWSARGQARPDARTWPSADGRRRLQHRR